jgi:hypothetical protein
MCRNRVIVTGLPAIQPAHELCNPLAHTSIHQPENQSVRKPACKSVSSGLASYYIVKTYWKTFRQALRTPFQYSVFRCLQQATVGNSFNCNFPQFRAINSLLPIATVRSVAQLLRIRCPAFVYCKRDGTPSLRLLSFLLHPQANVKTWLQWQHYRSLPDPLPFITQ